MSGDPDGFTERRASTPVGDTGSVPAGSLLTVPSAPPTGAPGSAPIVAVNTTHWYSDPTFITAAGGAIISLVPVIVDALNSQKFDWKNTVTSALLALAAYFRNRNNTVLK